MMAGGPSTSAAGAGGPRPVPVPQQHEAVKEKRDLASWWKNFKGRDKKSPEQVPSQGIFGIPLQTSIRYANVAISLLNDEGQSYIYGYVPIVVAKCGVFLKEKATDVEGIFRLAGSEKRIKELKVAFDSPDRYGKGLDWTGYTVHDAANILRRYFNQLPEPIIPLEFYERFRDPLRNHQQQAVGHIDAQAPSEGTFNHEGAIKIYQRLITELPPLNRQLLLYILDLLAVFASKSDLNKMTTANLAAIFQPGILSHPQHDMAPKEYRLSQDVLIFLIENQDSFLIGMQGTAADAETVRDVQSGSPTKPSTPTTPNRTQTVIGRSGSNSTVGGESVRKWGSIRRNVSVSSKHSKKSEAGGGPAVVAAPGTPTNGVHRSNTVPSRRAVSSTQSPRFPREKTSDPPTPTTTTAASTPPAVPPAAAPVALIPTAAPPTDTTPVAAVPAQTEAQQIPARSAVAPVPPPGPPEITSASSSEVTTPLAGVGSDTASAMTREYQTPKKDTTPLLAPQNQGNEKNTDRSLSNTPSTAPGRNFLGILKQSPGSDSDSRKPNKLQKRRTPGSTLSSAHSSSHSLDEGAQRTPVSPVNASSLAAALQAPVEKISGSPTQAITNSQPRRETAGSATRPPSSPPRSFHSHTDTSDADMVGDDMPTPQADHPERGKRRSRWRLSRSTNKVDQPATPSYGLGDQAMSRSTIGSGGSQTRRSFQEAAPLNTTITEQSSGHPSTSHSVRSPTSETVFSDSERERKGPMSWIRGKLQERKEKEAEKRIQSPERGHERSWSRPDLNQPLPAPPPPEPRSVPSQSIDQSPAPAPNPEKIAATVIHPPVSAVPPPVGKDGKTESKTEGPP